MLLKFYTSIINLVDTINHTIYVNETGFFLIDSRLNEHHVKVQAINKGNDKMDINIAIDAYDILYKVERKFELDLIIETIYYRCGFEID